MNYVYTEQLLKELVTDESELNGLSEQNKDISRTVNYSDGLGRVIQTIGIRQSPLFNDIVIHYEYNDLGIQDTSYLPYAAHQSTGAFCERARDDQLWFYNTENSEVIGKNVQESDYPYAVSKHEKSPLMRITEQGAPGSAWQPDGGHTIRTSYLTNTQTEDEANPVSTDDNIVKWNMLSSETTPTIDDNDKYYDTGELYVVQTTDENGNVSAVYTDKSGNEIMKKSEVIENSVLVDVITLYIYDERGNLRLIIPPEAVKRLESNDWDLEYCENGPGSPTIQEMWCTYFEYDGYDRLVEKHIPEAEPLYTVYDILGRIVLTQDGNLRAENKWLFNKYDVHGNIIITGFYQDDVHILRTAMQNHVDDQTSHFWEVRTNVNDCMGYSCQAFPLVNNPDNIYSVTYYDDYDFDSDGEPDYFYTSNFGNSAIKRLKVKGKITGTKTRILGIKDVEILLGDNLLEYDDNPADNAMKIYIKANSIVLQPGFSTAAGQEVKIGPDIEIPAESVGSAWITTANFYDTRYRLIQQQIENHMSGTDLIDYEYDFAGNLIKSINNHITPYFDNYIKKEVNLDHSGRIETIEQGYKSYIGGVSKTLSESEYNELGQLVTKNLDPYFLNKSIDYQYNIRGWLKRIYNQWFKSDIYYARSAPFASVPQYNGNISAITWYSRGYSLNIQKHSDEDYTEGGYSYEYDKLNRLKKADYHNEYATISWQTSDKFDIDDITYDRNGNIRSIVRRGLTVEDVDEDDQNEKVYGEIDNLNYEYSGNKLTYINDNVTDASTANNGKFDFRDGQTENISYDPENPEYQYDDNGNMETDKNKGIQLITYNHLNLPEIIDFGNGNKIELLYDATGTKLRRTVKENDEISAVTNYCNGFVYENSELSYVLHDEGRAKPVYPDNEDGIYFNYEYHLKDHLGNVRVTFDGNSVDTDEKILEDNHYYPFGMRIRGIWDATADIPNKYMYNSKEFEDELGLNWYHYGARYYDPQLGRWHSVDPVDELHSPYCYVDNDPVNAIDPDGTKIFRFLGHKGTEIKTFSLFDPSTWKSAFGDYVQYGDGPLVPVNESSIQTQYLISQWFPEPGLEDYTFETVLAVSSGVGLTRQAVHRALFGPSIGRALWSGELASPMAKASGASVIQRTWVARNIAIPLNTKLPKLFGYKAGRWMTDKMWVGLSRSFANGARGSLPIYIDVSTYRGTASYFYRAEISPVVRNSLKCLIEPSWHIF